MLERIILYEEANGIGWLGLKIAIFKVQHLIEEFSHMKAQSALLLGGESFGVFVWQYPPAVGSTVFQLITIEFCFFEPIIG